MVKKLMIAGMVLVFISISAALAVNEPYVMSFQGKLEGLQGQTSANIDFSLYNNSAGTGNPVWTESHAGVPLEPDSGIFNVLLGNTTALDTKMLDYPKLWLKVSVNGQDLGPLQPLTAAPYAFVAKNLYMGRVVAMTDSKDLVAVLGVNTSNVAGTYGEGVYGTSALGDGVHGKTASAAKAGVYGENTSSGAGVYGQAPSGTGIVAKGNSGLNAEATGTGDGVVGTAKAATKSGVYGYHSGDAFGVFGRAESGYGVYGHSKAGSDKAGVKGEAVEGRGVEGVGPEMGVYGESSAGHGVYGKANAAGKAGVYGFTEVAGGGAFGVSGTGYSNNTGVYGSSSSGRGISGNTTSGVGVYAYGGVSGNAIEVDGKIRIIPGDGVVDSNSPGPVTINKASGTVKFIGPCNNYVYVENNLVNFDSQVFVTGRRVTASGGNVFASVSNQTGGGFRINLSNTPQSGEQFNVNFLVLN